MGISKKAVLIFVIVFIVLPNVVFSQSREQSILGSFWNWLFKWFAYDCCDDISCNPPSQCDSSTCSCTYEPTETSTQTTEETTQTTEETTQTTEPPTCSCYTCVGYSCISRTFAECPCQDNCPNNCQYIPTDTSTYSPQNCCCCSLADVCWWTTRAECPGESCQGASRCETPTPTTSTTTSTPTCAKEGEDCDRVSCCAGLRCDHSTGTCISTPTSTSTSAPQETCCCCGGGCGSGKSCAFVTGSGGCGNKICPEAGLNSVCDVKYCQGPKETCCCCKGSCSYGRDCGFVEGENDCANKICPSGGYNFVCDVKYCQQSTSTITITPTRSATQTRTTTPTTSQTTRSTSTSTSSSSSTSSMSTTTTKVFKNCRKECEENHKAFYGECKFPLSCYSVPGIKTKLIGETDDCKSPRTCCCLIKDEKIYRDDFNQIGSTWYSKLNIKAKKLLWIVLGDALPKDRPVIVESDVDMIKFTPAQSGKLKILIITFYPEVKVYKRELQVTSTKTENDVILSCSQSGDSINCEWFNCQLKDKTELTILEYGASEKPSFVEIIPVSGVEGSTKSSSVKKGIYLASLSCDNGEDADLVEIE